MRPVHCNSQLVTCREATHIVEGLTQNQCTKGTAAAACGVCGYVSPLASVRRHLDGWVRLLHNPGRSLTKSQKLTCCRPHIREAVPISRGQATVRLQCISPTTEQQVLLIALCGHFSAQPFKVGLAAVGVSGKTAQDHKLLLLSSLPTDSRGQPPVASSPDAVGTAAGGVTGCSLWQRHQC